MLAAADPFLVSSTATYLRMSSTRVSGKARMSEPNELSAEATQGGLIGVEDMRLWKAFPLSGLVRIGC